MEHPQELCSAGSQRPKTQSEKKCDCSVVRLLGQIYPKVCFVSGSEYPVVALVVQDQGTLSAGNGWFLSPNWRAGFADAEWTVVPNQRKLFVVLGDQLAKHKPNFSAKGNRYLGDKTAGLSDLIWQHFDVRHLHKQQMKFIQKNPCIKIPPSSS
jgi:hypothetical protein